MIKMYFHILISDFVFDFFCRHFQTCQSGFFAFFHPVKAVVLLFSNLSNQFCAFFPSCRSRISVIFFASVTIKILFGLPMFF